MGRVSERAREGQTLPAAGLGAADGQVAARGGEGAPGEPIRAGHPAGRGEEGGPLWLMKCRAGGRDQTMFVSNRCTNPVWISFLERNGRGGLRGRVVFPHPSEGFRLATMETSTLRPRLPHARRPLPAAHHCVLSAQSRGHQDRCQRGLGPLAPAWLLAGVLAGRRPPGGHGMRPA